MLRRSEEAEAIWDGAAERAESKGESKVDSAALALATLIGRWRGGASRRLWRSRRRCLLRRPCISRRRSGIGVVLLVGSFRGAFDSLMACSGNRRVGCLIEVISSRR